MVKLVAVANRKGGSGKSTLAVNLAVILGRRLPAVLVDLDPQGSAVGMLESTDALPVLHLADPSALAGILARGKSGRGLVIVDLPPLDETITAATLRLADLVVIPVRPTPPDVQAAAPLIAGIVTTGRPAIAVLNQVRPGSRSARTARETLEELGIKVCKAEIGFRVAFADAAAEKVSIVDQAPGSPAALEMQAVAREIGRLLEV